MFLQVASVSMKIKMTVMGHYGIHCPCCSLLAWLPYNWLTLLQVAGMISAAVVMIVILALGHLLEPLQKVGLASGDK